MGQVQQRRAGKPETAARQGVDWTTRVVRLAGAALVLIDATTPPEGTDTKTLAVATMMLAGAAITESVLKHLIDRMFGG